LSTVINFIQINKPLGYNSMWEIVGRGGIMLAAYSKVIDQNKLINHQNITGEKVLFYYHQRMPILAFVTGDNIELFTEYFLNPIYFHQPPCWIVFTSRDTESVYQYVDGKYILNLNNINSDEMIRNSKPILLTPTSAKVVLSGIYKENEEWLQNDRSKRAISTIPRIFSEQDTLIYELIQNAFDSNASNVCIDLNDNELIFSHNGIPFTESDVNSISFVNLSTKGKDKVGFMGIGFKSVFLASKKPEIHSYPFSFQFNCEENEYGFILPTSIDRKEVTKPYTTLIFLPFMESNIFNGLNSSLLPYKQSTHNGISSKTFLHLVKISNEGLAGITEIKTPYTEMTLRQGELEGTFEVTTNVDDEQEKEVWLRLENKCTPDRQDIEDFLTTRQIQDKNLLEETWDETVSIAIKLVKNANVFSPDLNYEGIINVYLPTKISTGLRFDLQGNFLVNASREGLKNTSGRWNTKLFKKISDLLIDLLRWCKSYSNSKQINVANFYSVIPDWDDFFLDDELTDGIKVNFKEKFTQEPLIPIALQNDVGFEFCFPEQCIIVDKQLYDLLGKKAIEEYTGKKVVLQDLDDRTINTLTELFEIKEWTINDTVAYFQNKDWYKNIPFLKKQKQWNILLTRLYSYFFDQIPFTNFYINKLKDCFVYPINWDSKRKLFEFTDGHDIYRLPSDKPILPFDMKDKNNINILNQSFDNFVSGRTITKEDDSVKLHLKGAREFLEELPIKKLEAATVIEDFIIPIFKNVYEYQLDEVIRYTRYIGKHFNDVKRKKSINNILLLNKTGKFCSPKDLYFAKEYQSRELEVFFGKRNSELFVSELYLQNNDSVIVWFDMFKRLGVNDKPDLVKVSKQIHYCYEEGKELKERLGLPDPRTGYVNKNFPGNKYHYINYDFNENVKQRIVEIKANSSPLYKTDSMTAFLHLLNENWDYYAKRSNCEVHYFVYAQPVYDFSNPNRKKDTIKSTFFQYLLESSWVPVKNSADLCIPNDVYVLTDEDKEVISDILICNSDLSNENFIKALNFKTYDGNISTFDRLLAKTINGENNISIFREIYTVIMNDYKEGHRSKEEIKIFFENNKVIYGEGKYWAASDVLYKPESALKLYLPVLEELYPDLEEFFIDILEVKESDPSISIIRRFFIYYLWVSERGMSDEFRSAIIYGYRRLLSYINDENTLLNSNIADWAEFKENAKVFCKNNVGWVGNKSDKPILYLDKGKYEKQFLRSGNVFIESHLTQLRRETDELIPLLELLNIVPESTSINEINNPKGIPHLYVNQPIVEKNLHYLYQIMISLIDSFESENNDPGISILRNRVLELVDSKYTIYKIDEITSSIQLYNNELLKLDRNCMIENVEHELIIYVVDEIKIIYGAFKDELIGLLDITKIPVELKNQILNLVSNTVANIEDEYFNASIKRYLKEIGFVKVNTPIVALNENSQFKAPTELQVKEDSKDLIVNQNIDETETSKIEKDVIVHGFNDSYLNSSEMINAPKQPYKELVSEIELDNLKIVDATDGDGNNISRFPKNVNNGTRGTSAVNFPINKYSDEDGSRGENIVFELEKKRLQEIGLAQYISQIKHVSKVNKGNPWDIESFDKTSEGNIVPIRIEVKSTTEESKYVFPMSGNEYQEAFIENHQKGDLYIYRVFSVRSSKPRIMRFNFKEHFKAKKIKVNMKDVFIEIIQVETYKN
jgi:Domain of unknown function (DUF3883)